jgi:hypothetical protein
MQVLCSIGFAKQIILILHILCYNDSLLTWTVVSLTTAKFNTLIRIFSMSGFALSYISRTCSFAYWTHCSKCHGYNISVRTTKKKTHRSSIVPCVFIAAGTCLPKRCLETVAVHLPYIAVVAYWRLYTLQYIQWKIHLLAIIWLQVRNDSYTLLLNYSC